jgi:hypothetical protein
MYTKDPHKKICVFHNVFKNVGQDLANMDVKTVIGFLAENCLVKLTLWEGKVMM